MDTPPLDLSPTALDRYLAPYAPPAISEPVQSDEARGLHPLWWAAIVGAQVADAVTTNAAIARGGRETNPLMRGLTQHPTGLVVFKVGVGVGMAAMLHHYHKKAPTDVKFSAGLTAALTAVIAVANHRVHR